MLSRVDVLLSRLEEFQATGHRYVAEQVLVLLSGLTDHEWAAAAARAKARRLSVALDGMRAMESEISAGRRPPPTPDVWHEIARTFMRAEYDRTDA